MSASNKPRKKKPNALVSALLASEAKEQPGLTQDQMIEALQEIGYRVTKEAPKQDEITVDLSKQFRETGQAKVGAFSCPHLASIHQQKTHLREFYRRCRDEGIDTILCAGDVTEGSGRMYRGQEYEIFVHGADAQRDYAAEHFPFEKGIQTIVISGNHDYSHKSRGGTDIVSAIAAKRPDMTYLGVNGGWYNIKVGKRTVRIYMMHGKGAVPYARSYKLQKIIEGFSSENKPHVLLAGHWHSFAHIPMYRNVIGWALGCFQAQTDFEKSLGLNPEIGGMILTVGMGDDGIVSITNRVVPYYVPIDNDR